MRTNARFVLLWTLLTMLLLSGCAKHLNAPSDHAFVDIMVNGTTATRCPCEHNRTVREEWEQDGAHMTSSITLSNLGGWTCTLPGGYWFWATPTYIPPTHDVQGRRSRARH